MFDTYFSKYGHVEGHLLQAHKNKFSHQNVNNILSIDSVVCIYTDSKSTTKFEEMVELQTKTIGKSCSLRETIV